MANLIRISSANLTCYENLSQQYEAEFSNLTGKTPNSLGLYSITQIEKPEHLGYLFQDDPQNPLGFIVLDRTQARIDIMEFYVIPTARRRRLGTEMAKRIFELYPGPWQIRQLMHADRSYAFWIAALQSLVPAGFDDHKIMDREYGEMHCQHFEFKLGA